jgi:hypothetical protein
MCAATPSSSGKVPDPCDSEVKAYYHIRPRPGYMSRRCCRSLLPNPTSRPPARHAPPFPKEGRAVGEKRTQHTTGDTPCGGHHIWWFFAPADLMTMKTDLMAHFRMPPPPLPQRRALTPILRRLE